MRVNFDGSCGPKNPGGEMGWGVVIRDDEGRIVDEIIGRRRADPRNSNNLAEYIALSEALHWLEENNHLRSRVMVFGDSQLVILQMTGSWKIKRGRYAEEALSVQRHLARFENVTLHWVARSDNSEADALSKHPTGIEDFYPASTPTP